MGIIEVARCIGLGILIPNHMGKSKIGLLEQSSRAQICSRSPILLFCMCFGIRIRRPIHLATSKTHIFIYNPGLCHVQGPEVSKNIYMEGYN